MVPAIPDSRRPNSSGFQKVVAAFLSGEGLPFAEILSAARIERIFRKHGGLFGLHGVYTTAIVVWSFLSQVLRDGKDASCQAAVARVVGYCEQQGLDTPTADTGDYCRARAKLPLAALRELSCDVADELEHEADASWLWKGKHHAKLIDGFTFTMPDTPQNQATYPQAKTQQPGVGLPIARAVAIVSLATACVMDLAIGPYQGKETGEPALLRSMLGSLAAGDIAVMDRYYCSFMMIALLLAQRTHTCAASIACATRTFAAASDWASTITSSCGHDRSVRSGWMRKRTRRSPNSWCCVRFGTTSSSPVGAPGRSTSSPRSSTPTSTPKRTSPHCMVSDGTRNSILRIKSNLNLAHVRSKSPEMVHREVWTTLLGYNLIRTTAAGAALVHGKQPRQLSFTTTCQYVLASWMQLSAGLIAESMLEDYLMLMLKQIAACEVANRPGRLEPRVLKRRRHGYKLMQKPRNDLRREPRKRRA